MLSWQPSGTDQLVKVRSIFLLDFFVKSLCSFFLLKQDPSFKRPPKQRGKGSRLAYRKRLVWQPRCQSLSPSSPVSILSSTDQLNQSQHANFHVTILVTERDKDRVSHSLLAPIFEFSVNGWSLVRISRFHFQNYIKMVFAAVLWLEENSVSVINEKHVILGEDLELKESLTVDVSTGKNSKGRLAVYKIIWWVIEFK